MTHSPHLSSPTATPWHISSDVAQDSVPDEHRLNRLAQGRDRDRLIEDYGHRFVEKLHQGDATAWTEFRNDNSAYWRNFVPEVWGVDEGGDFKRVRVDQAMADVAIRMDVAETRDHLSLEIQDPATGQWRSIISDSRTGQVDGPALGSLQAGMALNLRMTNHNTGQQYTSDGGMAKINANADGSLTIAFAGREHPNGQGDFDDLVVTLYERTPAIAVTGSDFAQQRIEGTSHDDRVVLGGSLSSNHIDVHDGNNATILLDATSTGNTYASGQDEDVFLGSGTFQGDVFGGGHGDDLFKLEGTLSQVNLDGGMDGSLDLNGAMIHTPGGNDVFQISGHAEDVLMAGHGGDDQFALAGSSHNTRIHGAAGSDVVQVVDGLHDALEIMTGKEADVVQLMGQFLGGQAFLGQGDDLLVLEGETRNAEFHLDKGDDKAFISGLTENVKLFLGKGNDYVTIGSDWRGTLVIEDPLRGHLEGDEATHMDSLVLEGPGWAKVGDNEYRKHHEDGTTSSVFIEGNPKSVETVSDTEGTVHRDVGLLNPGRLWDVFDKALQLGQLVTSVVFPSAAPIIGGARGIGHFIDGHGNLLDLGLSVAPGGLNQINNPALRDVLTTGLDYLQGGHQVVNAFEDPNVWNLMGLGSLGLQIGDQPLASSGVRAGAGVAQALLNPKWDTVMAALFGANSVRVALNEQAQERAVAEEAATREQLIQALALGEDFGPAVFTISEPIADLDALVKDAKAGDSEFVFFGAQKSNVVGASKKDLLFEEALAEQNTLIATAWDGMNFGLSTGHPHISTVRGVLSRVRNQSPLMQSLMDGFLNDGGTVVVDYNLSSAAGYSPGKKTIYINPNLFDGSDASFTGSQAALAGDSDTAITVAHELGHWWADHIEQENNLNVSSGFIRHGGVRFRHGIVEDEVFAEVVAFVYRNNRWPNQDEILPIVEAVVEAYAPPELVDNRTTFFDIPIGRDPNANFNNPLVLYGGKIGTSEVLQTAWERINNGMNGGRNYDQWVEEAIQAVTGVKPK